MTTTRALLAILVLSLVAAGLVALASRSPAELRRARPPAEDVTDPSLGATFTDQQVERHDAFRRGGYAGFAASVLLEIAVLILLARGPLRGVLEWAGELPGGWIAKAVVAALFVAVVGWLAQIPLGYVRGYVVQHDWGLSTQDVTGWMLDRARSLLVAAVIAIVGAVVFYGLVRWQPRSWWLWGWAGFTILTAILFFLYPVLIAPLFNRFTPLDDPDLTGRIKEIASEAGISVDEVLVSDASRRSTVENAYVAGLGPTKQVVVYDTLLAAGDGDETLYVVAHELGHQVERHVLKNLALSSGALLLGFAALAALARTGVWSWAGATGPRDPAALPLLLVFATVAGLVLLPAQNAVSRRFEARSDEIALELTADPPTAIRVHRRLAFSNLADLDPAPFAVWLLYSHPPVADRIGAAMAEMRAAP